MEPYINEDGEVRELDDDFFVNARAGMPLSLYKQENREGSGNIVARAIRRLIAKVKGT